MTSNLKIFFTSPVRFKSFFTLKDKLKIRLKIKLYSGISVLGAMLPIMVIPSVHICEHFGNSHLTGKKMKIDSNKLKAIQELL